MNAEKTGTLIYEIRCRKNLTQKELAEMVNVSDKAVSKWERGEGCPDVTILPALANALGIEMETLMNGELPVTQDVSGKEIKEYNFRQPDRYPRNMQRDLWMLGDIICQKINSEFSSMLNDRCESNVFNVDQMVNAEFLRSVPKNCFFYDFDYVNNGLCIVVDSEIGKAFLKQDYKKYETVNQFDLEVFKNYQLSKIVEAIRSEITNRTENQLEMDCLNDKKLKQYSNPNSSLQEENRMMLLLSLKCSVGETEGWVNIQFSDGLLEQMMMNNFFNEAASTHIKFQELSNIKNKELPPNVFIEFGRYNPENVDLEFGKILIMDKKENEGLNVVYENKVIHSGKVMSIDDLWGIQISETPQLNEIVYDEEDYISVQLGYAALRKEEISALRQGSYIILKQRAGELCHIIRKGKVIATGEICIADDLFAIRIVDVK